MGLKINYRYCPQCRRPFEFDEEDQPHCAPCDITIYHDVVAGVSVIPIKDGKVLLARRALEPYKGKLDLIGGFMKPGETAEQNALREAIEETGLTLKLTGVLGHYNDKYGEGAYTFGITFLAEIVSGEPVAADDVASLEWYDIQNIPQVELDAAMKNVKEALADLKKLQN